MARGERSARPRSVAISRASTRGTDTRPRLPPLIPFAFPCPPLARSHVRRSLRLKALILRSAVAALIAALLGGLLQLSPQPITDQLLRWDLAPQVQRQVLLVEMDAHASPGASIRLASQLRDGRAAAIVLVGDRIPALADDEVVLLVSPDSAQVEVGLVPDWDHRNRTWKPHLGNTPSLPTRILEAAGLAAPRGPQRTGHRHIPPTHAHHKSLTGPVHAPI